MVLHLIYVTKLYTNGWLKHVEINHNIEHTCECSSMRSLVNDVNEWTTKKCIGQIMEL